MDKMKTAKAMAARSQTAMLTFDVRDMPVKLEDGMLHIESPIVLLPCDLLQEEARETMKLAGLKEREIDATFEDAMEDLHAILLGRMLQQRRR